MKQFFLLLLFFLTTTLGFSQDRRTAKFIDEYLSVAFDEIEGVKQPLTKWGSDVKTLKYKVIGEFQYMNDRTWNKYLLEIKELTGIEMSRTDKDDYNILIFFGEINDYVAYNNNDIPLGLANKFSGWNSKGYNSDRSLRRASLCIVPNKIRDGNQGTYRLKNGILRAFGICGEIEYKNSIFYKYSTTTNTRLSRKDKRYIKLHYNESIKPDSRYEETKQILRNLSNIKKLSREKL